MARSQQLTLAPAPTSENPFIRARNEWDTRLANQAAQVRNWQFVALVLLLLVFFLAAGSFYLATQSRVVPYVVAVDQLGQPVAFGPVEPLKSLDERLYRYLLSLWVFNTRSVVSDPEAQKALLFAAYAYTEGAGTGFLNDHFRAHSPFERAKSETVSIQVHAILRLGPTSWQVQWTESRRHPLLGSTTEERWQAVLETRLEPPARTDQLLANPVGLWITGVNWTRTV